MAQRRRFLTILSVIFILVLAFAVLGAIRVGGGGASTLKQAFVGGDGTLGQATAVKPFRLEGCTTETLDFYCDETDGWIMASSTAGGMKAAYAVTTNSKAAAYTIGTDDANESYGGIIYVTAAAVITAPAVVDGMNFRVVSLVAGAVSVDMNVSDRMYLDGVALDDGDKATSLSASGDEIYCAYESAAGFFCSSNGWTDGGA